MKETKEEYELPQIAVWGIVLEEGIATPCSVRTVSITQEAWGSDTTYGNDTGDNGDLWLAF